MQMWSIVLILSALALAGGTPPAAADCHPSCLVDVDHELPVGLGVPFVLFLGFIALLCVVLRSRTRG